MKSNPLGINLFLIGVAVAAMSLAQTAQSHPELCGRPGASIPVPEGVRWVPPPTAASLGSTLFVKNAGGEREIDLEVWPSVEQICPVPGDQLVLFGEPGDGNYSITRVDRANGRIIDSIGGRDPLMSPDQHWLIMRPYYHFRSELSDSEEYLLYDLTVDGEKNTMKGLTPFTQDLTGRPVYPVPHDGVPFEFKGQPVELTHTFRSDRFYWAPDSSAVAFADSVMDKMSMVVVQIEPKGPSTLVLPIDVSGLCEATPEDNPVKYAIPTLTGVDFGSSRTLFIQFAASDYCKSAQMTLHLADFHSPRPEVHTAPGPKRTTAPGAAGVGIEQK
jgi:hypothetical protein